MNSRQFKQQITIQSPPTAVDSYGDLTGSWTDVVTARASVLMLTGSSLERAQQQYSEASWQVDLRYQNGLTLKENYRVSWGSQTLEIGSIENVNQANRKWRLICSEVKPE